MGLFQSGAQLHHAISPQHELTYKVHDLIQTPRLDPNSLISLRARLGALLFEGFVQHFLGDNFVSYQNFSEQGTRILFRQGFGELLRRQCAFFDKNRAQLWGRLWR